MRHKTGSEPLCRQDVETDSVLFLARDASERLGANLGDLELSAIADKHGVRPPDLAAVRGRIRSHVLEFLKQKRRWWYSSTAPRRRLPVVRPPDPVRPAKAGYAETYLAQQSVPKPDVRINATV